mgnify:CR=1 FL=1
MTQPKIEAQICRLIRVTDTQAKKLAKLTDEVAALKKEVTHLRGNGPQEHTLTNQLLLFNEKDD